MDERKNQAGAAGHPLPEAPIVGREPQLGELLERAAAVLAARTPRAVTVLGGAGVGKSRLLSEFLVRLRAREPRWRVLKTQVRPGGSALGPVQRLLKARFGLLDVADTEAARARVREQVEAVLGDRRSEEFLHFLGAYLGLEFPGTPFARAVEETAAERRAVGRAVLRRFLELDAREQPLLLLVEDLHYAPEDTLDLFHCLATGLQEGPVLLLFGARPELLARRGDWFDGGSGKARHDRLDLAPLGPDEAAQLVERLLGAWLPEVPEALIDAAVDEAGGNPYLLRQIVRSFAEHGVVHFEPGGRASVRLDRLDEAHLPLDVEQAIGARIASLAPAERELLERAAALGGVFWLGALVAIERHGARPPELWGGQDSLATHYEQMLDDLAERDFVLRMPDSTLPGEIEYAFRHNLERELLARLAPPAERRSHQRVLAEWLQARLPEPDEAQCEMLAQAYEAGGVGHAAARFYLEAAERARARYANRKAAEYFGRGLALLGEEDAVARLQALHDHGDVLQLDGRNEEALAAFQEMLQLAWRLDLRAKGGVAHNRIGRLYRSIGRLREAMRHLGTALALFEASGDERGIASTLDDIGKVHWMRGDYETAERFTLQALERRRALGDDRGVALGYNNLGIVYQDSGRFAEALEAFQQALELRRSIDDLPGIAQSLNNLGTVYQDRGEHERAAELYREALQVARRVGDRMRQAVVLTNLGESEYRRGRPKEAIEVLREAERLSEGLGDLILEGEILRGLAKAHLLARDETRAREYIDAAIDRFERAGGEPFLGVALRTFAEISAEAGWGGEEHERAQQAFERAMAIFEQLGNDVELLRTAEAYASFLERHAASDADAAARARKLRERAEAIRGRLHESGERSLAALRDESTQPTAPRPGS